MRGLGVRTITSKLWVNETTCLRRIRSLCDEAARSQPNPSCRLQNKTMFRIHKHNKYPEYRLIIPRQAELPSELLEHWTACELTDRIEAQQREDIERSGYFLFRQERHESLWER